MSRACGRGGQRSDFYKINSLKSNKLMKKLYSSAAFLFFALLFAAPLAHASSSYGGHGGYRAQYSYPQNYNYNYNQNYNYLNEYSYSYSYPQYAYSYPSYSYAYPNYSYAYPSYDYSYTYPQYTAAAYSTYTAPTYSYSYSSPSYSYSYPYSYPQNQWVYCYPTQSACGNISPYVTYDYSNYHNYHTPQYYGVGYGGYDNNWHKKKHY